MKINNYKLFFTVLLSACIAVCFIKACVSVAPLRLHPQPSPSAAVPLPLPKSQRISVYDGNSGTLLDMELEEYLLGVVAAEMPASFELEALKCQAIAARTFTVRKIRAFGGSGCEYGGDICADSRHCQAYNPNKRSPNIDEAVRSTVGLIITYDGQPIEALYHSTAGGMTEDSSNVFANQLPYLRSVVSDEPDAPYYTDTMTLSRAVFADKANKTYKTAKLNAQTLEEQVNVRSRFSSGRIEKLRLGGVTITGKELRTLFGLRSTNVEFAFDKKNVIMTTRGFGHGVGMSQTGANAMAQNGATFEEILTYYYTGTRVGLIGEAYN